ncbi:unnamed protein product [[Candida] boidinii]|uniref:Unnamed protein product n=1 Tax=Candida boidinii TaxID=5477 RepID=A0A9W6SWN9_CANBO|nr:transferase activity protein [[Candida] boidinii]GME68605.1 unnamed protein product [[Candida] boidinii]GMF49764.1 unnamed protein product [[Candida] boidinii]
MAPTATSVVAPPMESKDITETYQMNEKVINEEFKIWKKTSPLLYDIITTFSSENPSLTIEWLKNYEIDDSKSILKAYFLAGSHTGSTNSNDNYVALYSVSLPAGVADEITEPASPKDGSQYCKFEIIKKWEHPGEVNKLRYNEYTKQFATMTNSGDVLLYDINKTDKPIMTLKYHTKEGFGLEWNPNKEKIQLLTSSEDSHIALWDFQSIPDGSKPLRVFKTHKSIVNDVSWNKTYDFIFASVGDDHSIQIHDLRVPDTESYSPIMESIDAHDHSINAVDFHPVISTILATGSSDNSVKCWDLRNLESPVRKFYGHNNSVTQVKFNTQSDNCNYLISTSLDRRVMFWDLSYLTEGAFDEKEYERKKGDYYDSCLRFVHGGHTFRVSEFDIHPTLPNLAISADSGSLIQVWRPNLPASYEDEDEDDDEDEDNDNGDDDDGDDGDDDEDGDDDDGDDEGDDDADENEGDDDADEKDEPEKSQDATSEAIENDIKTEEASESINVAGDEDTITESEVKEEVQEAQPTTNESDAKVDVKPDTESTNPEVSHAITNEPEPMDVDKKDEASVESGTKEVEPKMEVDAA